MRENESRLHALDGLRGWGALSVVVYHTFIQVFPPWSAHNDLLMRIAPLNGTLAVEIFFVVSGISLSIGFVTLNQRINLLKIAAGRYFRLTIPILIACLLIWFLANVDLIFDETRKANALSLTGIIKFALFRVYVGYTQSTSPIPPLWTMSFEIAGSAIVLLTLLVIGRHKARWLTYCAVFALSWKADPRYASFIIGIIIAEIIATPRDSANIARNVIGAAALIAGLVIATQLPGKFAEWYVVSAALIVFGALLTQPVQRFFSNSLSRWLGSISFPLYLLHAIVIFSLGDYLSAHHAHASLAWTIASDVLIVTASIAIGRLFRFIDNMGVAASKLAGRRVRAGLIAR